MSKAYRWRGGFQGNDRFGQPVYAGVLHIRIPVGANEAAEAMGNTRIVIVPPYEPGVCERACVIRDPVNLAALGDFRIAALVKEGSLEPVKWSEDILSWLHADSPDMERDLAEATVIAQASADATAAANATFNQKLAALTEQK